MQLEYKVPFVQNATQVLERDQHSKAKKKSMNAVKIKILLKYLQDQVHVAQSAV